MRSPLQEQRACKNGTRKTNRLKCASKAVLSQELFLGCFLGFTRDIPVRALALRANPRRRSTFLPWNPRVLAPFAYIALNL